MGRRETVSVDIELGAKAPWLVRRTMLVNGKPAPGIVVFAFHGTGVEPIDFHGANSDADGVVSLGPLLFDDYTLVARPLTGGWTCELPRIDRKAAANVNGTLEVSLVEGALQILDAATSKPLPHRRVGIVSTLPFNLGTLGMTDAEGRVTFSLCEGRYEVVDHGTESDPAVMTFGPHVNWTRQGPKPASVKFTVGR
jgi:hypothetical protein